VPLDKKNPGNDGEYFKVGAPCFKLNSFPISPEDGDDTDMSYLEIKCDTGNVDSNNQAIIKPLLKFSLEQGGQYFV
jgi:hypothetical protein